MCKLNLNNAFIAQCEIKTIKTVIEYMYVFITLKMFLENGVSKQTVNITTLIIFITIFFIFKSFHFMVQYYKDYMNTHNVKLLSTTSQTQHANKQYVFLYYAFVQSILSSIERSLKFSNLFIFLFLSN